MAINDGFSLKDIGERSEFWEHIFKDHKQDGLPELKWNDV